MKNKYQNLVALCAFAFALSNLNAEQSSSHQSSSSSVSKSVSVTSSGGKTIKKTVIIRDGVKEVITEITGKDGKTTIEREGGNNDAENEHPEANEGGVWLGARVKKMSNAMRSQLNLEEGEGVEVDLVAKDSPATAADIRVGDILLSLAGTSIASPEELSDEVNQHKAGDTVKLAYMRGGKRAEVDVTIQERPKKSDDEPEAGDGNKQDQDFDAILNDPNVPENFKNKIREMRKRMQDFQKKAGVDHINVVINGKDFEAILNNPDVPESFKQTVRDMLKKLSDFQNKN